MTRWYESTDHLYDRVDVWLAKYGADAYERLRPLRDGPSGEERFTELVRLYADRADVVVDIGTGDASWLMKEIAPHVHRVVGFDYGARRLWHGAQQRTALGAKNVELVLADGRRVPLRDGVADAIISRRGPWTASDPFMREGLRVLKSGGVALEIGIGERNGCEFDEMFGERHQMHASLTRGVRKLELLTILCEGLGIDVLVAEEYECREVFPSREALFFRLETAPGIDAFDPEQDERLVDAAIAAEGGGLAFTVHRICLVARKPN